MTWEFYSVTLILVPLILKFTFPFIFYFYQFEVIQSFLILILMHIDQDIKIVFMLNLYIFILYLNKVYCIVLIDNEVEFFKLQVIRFLFIIYDIVLYSLIIIVFRRFWFIKDQIQSYQAHHVIFLIFYFQPWYFTYLETIYYTFQSVYKIDYV